MTDTQEPTDGIAPDTINDLAGIAAGSSLAQLRNLRPEAVRAAQGSYHELLEPDDLGGVSRREREIVALRVAVLTPDTAVAAWHRARLRDLGADDAIIAAVEHFPDGNGLSTRERAILQHTDRITHAPGAARPEHIAAMKVAGLTPHDIVTVSQLIAYMSFEVRVLATLRLLAEDA